MYSYIFFFFGHQTIILISYASHPTFNFFPGACTIIYAIYSLDASRVAGVETVCMYMHTILNNNASVGGNYTLSCRLIECTRIQIAVRIIIVIKIQKKIKYLHALCIHAYRPK